MKKSLLNKCESPEQERELKQSFVAAHLLREKLGEVLVDKAVNAQRNSIGKEGYDCPNWAYKQADIVGYQRALNEIMNLLDD